MAAATGCYKRILQVLDKWPIDKTKTGRDLGQFLREIVNKSYKTNHFEENIKYWDKQYLSLQKLLDNQISTNYPRTLSSSATGLTREQCQIALSNSFLQELQEEEEGFFKKYSPFKAKDKNKNETE